MKIVERTIFKIPAGKMGEVKALEDRFAALEGPLGFPTKRRYQCLAGPHDSDTYIYECDWDSFAAAEAALQRYQSDPQLQALDKEGSSVFTSRRTEFYTLLD